MSVFVKIFGAMIVILGCGGFGFHLAASYRREERILRQLCGALDFMGCELQYRMTALPELCRQTAGNLSGSLRQVFCGLAREMDNQVSPDVERCMDAALSKTQGLSEKVTGICKRLGSSMGRFDLPGQLKGLEAAREDCRRELDGLAQNRDNRLRSFQTLGLCAGAALAILFL